MKKSRIFLDNQDPCFNLARHKDFSVKYRSNPQAKVDSYTVYVKYILAPTLVTLIDG